LNLSIVTVFSAAGRSEVGPLRSVIASRSCATNSVNVALSIAHMGKSLPQRFAFRAENECASAGRTIGICGGGSFAAFKHTLKALQHNCE